MRCTWSVFWRVGLVGLGLGCTGQVRPSLSLATLAPPHLDTVTHVTTLAPPTAVTQTACLANPSLLTETSTQPAGSIAGKLATVHWPDRRGNPIRVWIQPAPKLAGWTEEDRLLVARAFHAWDKAGLPVQFLFINNAAGADIVVRWIDRFTTQHEGWTTMWWDRQGWIQNGDMVLALRAPTGRKLTPIELQAIATHEVGHVLGLAHSGDATMVMASTIYAADVTRSDVVVAQSLYAQQPGHSMESGRADGRNAAKIGRVKSCLPIATQPARAP